MTLAIFQPENDHRPIIHAFAPSEGDVWTFYKIGKRGGKLYRNQKGVVAYESNLPAGAKKVERDLTPKEQAKQAHFEKKEQRKTLRAQREAEHQTPTSNEKEALPLSPEETAKAEKKLAKLLKQGAKAAEYFAYSTKKALGAKKQAIIDAAKAVGGKDQGTAIQRAKKAGAALSKAAFASYHLHKKRYGKPMALVIEGVKAAVNLTVSAPLIVAPAVGAFVRNSITGPAIDYVARRTAKSVIYARQLARGRWKPRPKSHAQAYAEVHSQAAPAQGGSLSFEALTKIIRTSLHVDAVKARLRVPRVSLEQVARSLESLLNSVVPDEQSQAQTQRKAA